MKIKIKLSIIYFIVALQILSYSQTRETLLIDEISLTNEYIKSLKNDDKYKLNSIVIQNLHLIYQFNLTKKIIGQIDTIRVYKLNNEHRAKYKEFDLNLTERPSIKEDNLINIWGTKHNTLGFLFSETYLENGNSQRITVSADSQNEIKIEKYINGIRYGEYKELSLEGTPRVIGQYTLKDSIYQDTILTFDYWTYEEQTNIISRKHTSTKCGDWIYYKDGEIKTIIKTEINCK